MGDCIVDTTDGVMVIKFNRPERMNSLGGTLLEGQRPRSSKAARMTGSAPSW
ncbi:MAG: hypothetical protein IPI33_10855 [Dehalococcoidia bacterium]|nr:hypothetical protein [Dehalococcoidia bacterium]